MSFQFKIIYSPDFTLPLVAMAEIDRAVVVVTDTAMAIMTKLKTEARNKLGLSIIILWSWRLLTKSYLNGLNKNVLHVLYQFSCLQNLYNSIIMIHFPNLYKFVLFIDFLNFSCQYYEVPAGWNGTNFNQGEYFIQLQIIISC